MTAAFPLLTAKQQAVCDLVTHGFSSKEIGAQLGISHRTVQQHIKLIYRKYEVRNAVSLVRKIFA